ncbi:Heterokaryon incompatibility protein (HET) domain containing protein [Hyaloscypha variabilis]
MATTTLYQPLNLPDETRILTIHPGDYDAPIACNLEIISLSNITVPYEALSYCWSRSTTLNPPSPTTEIQCAVYDPTGSNTHTTTLQFQDLRHNHFYENHYYQIGGLRPPGTITCNGVAVTIGGELFSALRRLRKKDEEFRIWVDAICINQEDVEERNLHVRMMGAVYGMAETVRVWLGEEVGMEGMALRCLEGVNEKFGELFQMGLMGERGAVQYAFVNDEKIRELDWDELAMLLGRAWFERVWVIQEIANAKQAFIHIGPIVLGWEYFSAIISGMRSYNVDIHLLHCNAVKSICIMNMLRETRVSNPSPGEEANRMSLLELLEETRDFKSTLPCDKIYGILNLTKDSDSVDVDYTTDSSATFQTLAQTQLLKGESINILYHCITPSTPSTLSLPSWVPDWTTRGHVEPFLIRGLEAHATLNSTPLLHLSNNNKTLHITGKRLDKISIIEEYRPIPSMTSTRVADAAKGFQTPSEKTEARTTAFKEKSRIWVQNVLDIVFPDKENIDQEVMERLWRTFMCNRTRENAVPGPECRFGFEVYMEAALSVRTSTSVLAEWKANAVAKGDVSEEEGKMYDKAVETFHGANAKWCYNRRFFKTENGRFGWTVDGARVGDEICVLFEGDYPFVLRKEGDDDACYTIVGDAYVHGVMEGEGMEEDFPVHEFAIK